MLVKNATAFLDGRFCPGTSLHISGGRIAQIGSDLPAGPALDLGGDYLLPGFVDVHIHAFMGMDMMQGENAVRHMSRELKKMGVAAFLPTTMSQDEESTICALCGIQAVMNRPEPDGAMVLGAHMEAPFLSPDKAGAQRSEFFCRPTLDNWRKFTGDYESVVKKVTLAPELPGADELIRYLTGRGIVVSAGHTQATAGQFRASADAGLTTATHLFNAQSPLGHREPGVPGAALVDDRIYCEFIADGVHLHPDVVRMICRCKGAVRAIAITDATEAAGMPDGAYQLGGQPVEVTGGVVRLADGTLAGSTLTMARAFTNLVRYGIAPEDACRMTSRTPAESLGLTGYGEIRPGAPAVLVRFDREWNFVGVVGALPQTPAGG